MNTDKLTFNLSRYGENINFFGKSIILLSGVITIITFWFLVFTYYEPFSEVAALMINLIRVGVGLFIVGWLMKYLFFFINELVYNKKSKDIKLAVIKK